VSPDGRLVASGGGDHFIRLWEATGGRPRARLEGHAARVEFVAFSSDGRSVVSVGADQTLRLWDVVAAGEVRKIANPARLCPWAGLAADSKGVWLREAGSSAIVLRDLAGGMERRRIECGAIEGDNCPALSPDGRVLATYEALWDVATGRRQAISSKGGQFRTFSADGRTLVTVDVERSIRLWEVATGTERCRLLRHKRGPSSVALSPDGRTLASGDSHFHHLHLWDAPSGRLLASLRGHKGPITALAFTPDGRRLITASEDSTLLIWDVAGIREASAPKAEPTAEELEAAWADLGGNDAKTAYRAMWSLAAAPVSAVPLLRQRLGAVSLPEEERRRVAKLLADLDADEFAVREKASAELAKLGPRVKPWVRQVLDGNPSPEVRRRLGDLLDGMSGPWPVGEELRALRAVEALEYAGTDGARSLLQQLARGAPEALVTREAAAAVERLRRRGVPKP
jgi:hypothetical protein